MKKNGFTLVELLVVIAIIAILSVIIVPSVIKVNQTINERMYKQKKDNIVSAAELYASENPDIFNGAESVYIYVHQLIDANYIDTDIKYGDGNCNSKVDGNSIDPTQANGCIINPSAKDGEKVVMNDDKILVEKRTAGVVGTYMGDGEQSSGSYANNIRLVDAICLKINNGEVLGKWGPGENDTCTCDYNSSSKQYDKIVKADRTPINDKGMCMIVSKSDSGNVDNWLKYGSSTANWRVLGVYNVDGTLYAKMITNDVIE